MNYSALDRSHESLVAVKPQEYSQLDFSAEHYLTPWAQVSNSEDSGTSDINELPSFEGLNYFDDDFGPHATNTNHGDREIDHLEPSNSGEPENIGYVDPRSVHGNGDLPPVYTYAQILRSGITMDTSRVLLDAQTQCRPHQALKNMSMGPFETIGAESLPGNPTHLRRLKHSLQPSIPRVVTSDATVHTAGTRSESAAPARYTNIPSPICHDEGTRAPQQILSKALASGEGTEYLPENDRYRPNNYQIAMLDRQPPYTSDTGDQPQFGTPIAASVTAFYADADRTLLDAAVSCKIDEGFGFDVHGVTGSIPTFQTPIRPPPELQHCRSSSSTASSCSNPRSSTHAPLHSTPPSSFQETTECQRVGSHLTRDRSPSNLATLPSVCLTDPSSFTSPSLPNAPDEAKEYCRCTLCPDKIFTGTSNLTNLKRHMRDKHNGMAPLPCLKEGCDASFAPGRKDNLIKHVRAKHPDYHLPAPSRKRKRNADSDLESSSTGLQSFESGTTE